jgi:hypothetical protein
MNERPISNENQIDVYLHCGLCIEEWEAEHRGTISPKDFARVQAGWTKQGLQIWCNRHDVNIVHIDFDGQQMRANSSRASPTFAVETPEA